MAKTIAEINEKIKSGQAVVVTAEEVIELAEEKGIKKAAEEIDVVTTGTFSPMCSSGAYLNIGHTKPRMKLGGGQVYLNDVPAYAGMAATDIFIGANALPDDDARNKIHPGEFNYGGGHVIEDLVSGKDVRIIAAAYGTDCYPRKKLESWLNIKDVNEAVLFNMRNAYQNYNVAVNCSDKTVYTYMGILKPNMGNITYSSAGKLSPLMNDPYLKTIGIGTRIFLGGGVGYVTWQGTQHSPEVERTEGGVPKGSAATLAVIGDLKQMNSRYILGTSMYGYGASLTVGIGIPIPVLSEEILKYTLVDDGDIYAKVIDYGGKYQMGSPDMVAEVTYEELRSGKVIIDGKEIPSSSFSSYSRAVEIAEMLKSWIMEGKFTVTEPVEHIPGVGSGYGMKPFKERPLEEDI